MSEQGERGLSGPQARRIVEEWWRSLTQDRPGRPPDRGARAELRHCRGLVQVSLCEPFQKLYGRLEDLGVLDHCTGHQLAAAALVLAHVRTEVGPGHGLGKAMAQPGKNPGQGRVSGLRLRRLLALDDLEGLAQALIRVVRLMDEAAPVANLAADVFEWAGGARGREKVRQRWAYDYYANIPAEQAKDDKAA